jgi:hypothetical protein
MRQFETITALSILLLAGGCLGAATAQSRSAQEEEIREVVFRYLMSPTHFGSHNTHKVFFLSLKEDKDPSKALMKRFAGHKPPVKKVSQSHWNPKPIQGMDASMAAALYGTRDKATGQPGKIYYINEIKWLGNSKVEVSGGYYSGMRSGASATYTVILRAKRWVVLRVKNIMKS